MFLQLSYGLPAMQDLDYSQCEVTEIKFLGSREFCNLAILECPEKFANISSLGLAILGNKTEEMDALLSGICDPNDSKTLHTPSCNMHLCGWNGYPYIAGLSNLHLAVMKGNLFALEKLLAAKNIVVDSQDENGETPIMYAVRFGTELPGSSMFGTGSPFLGHYGPVATEGPENKLKMLNLLVDHGADFSKDGGSALSLAATIGQDEVVQFLQQWASAYEKLPNAGILETEEILPKSWKDMVKRWNWSGW